MGLRFNARTSSIETDAASVDFTQPVTTPASTTTAAGFNIAEAVAAPSAPVDGDVWVTAAGAFNARLNGVTVDLSASGGDVSKVGTPVDNQIGVWTGDGTIEGDANLTWDASHLLISVAPAADAATPTLAFGDGDTGFYERGDDILSVSTLATERFQFTGNLFQAFDSLGGGIVNETTSSTNPTLVPRRASTQTGIGAAGANALSLIANSTEMVAITETSVTINSAAQLATAASTATQAGLNIPEGVAPTTPADGDVWVTAAGAFNARLNGVTVDLASSSGITGTVADNQIVTGTGASTVDSSANLTFTGTALDINATVDINGGNDLRMYDAGNDDFLEFSHSGTVVTISTAGTGTGAVPIRFDVGSGDYIEIGNGGVNSIPLRISDGDASDYTSIYNNGTDTFFDVTGAGNVDIRQGTTRMASFQSNSCLFYYNGSLNLQTQQHDGFGNASGAQVRDHGGTLRYVGFCETPQFNFNVSDTLEARHMSAITGKTNTTSYTLTLAAASDFDFEVSHSVTVMNAAASVDYTINEGASTTLFYLDGSSAVDTAGGCTLGPGGIATIYRYAAGTYYIWGTGITA